MKKLRDAHPRQQFIIETAKEYGMHFLFVAKPGDHKYMFEWLNGFSGLPVVEYTDEKKKTHRFTWKNDVPLHGGKDAVKVNYIEYQQINPTGKVTYKNSWVGDRHIGNRRKYQSLSQSGTMPLEN